MLAAANHLKEEERKLQIDMSQLVLHATKDAVTACLYEISKISATQAAVKQSLGKLKSQVIALRESRKKAAIEKAKTRVERIGAMLKGLGRADQRMSVMETHDFGELDGLDIEDFAGFLSAEASIDSLEQNYDKMAAVVCNIVNEARELVASQRNAKDVDQLQHIDVPIHIYKTGVLVKASRRKNGRKTNWKERYFVLDGDEVRYYHQQSIGSKKPLNIKGRVPLDKEAEVVETNEKDISRPFVLEIRSPKAKKSAYYMEAASRQDMERWIAAIQEAIDCLDPVKAAVHKKKLRESSQKDGDTIEAKPKVIVHAEEVVKQGIEYLSSSMARVCQQDTEDSFDRKYEQRMQSTALVHSVQTLTSTLQDEKAKHATE